MQIFKHHQYPKILILQAIYFKLCFTLSYGDVEELLLIRCKSPSFDYSTLVFNISIQIFTKNRKEHAK